MDKDISILGLNIRYTDSGSGRYTVILMHGWGCSHATLASVEKVALQTGCRVINIDFPGFGQSQEPPTVWGVEDYTRFLEEFISALGVECPILLGHSFGGRVGILYASRHHDVKALILVDSAGIKPRRTLKYYWRVYTFKTMKRLMYVVYGRDEAERRLDVRRAKAVSSDYASASPMMRRILSKVVNEDLTGDLSKITAPALLVWGEEDTATPIADARKMERMIPGAGLVAFPGCGHYSFLDNPVQFAAVLRSFLGSITDNK